MRLTTLSASAVYSLSLLSQYASAHFDFTPRVENNAVVTGGHDDEQGVDVSSLRVGGYDFGENPDDPFNIGDPGFNTQGASAFAGGSTLRLTALAAGGSFLGYWDGTGDVNFSAAPAGTSLSLSGSPSRYVTYTGTSAVYTPSGTPSLLVGTFAGNGALHVHLGSSLASTAGTPADGAYLIGFELSNPGTGVAKSQPLYIVYNNNLTEARHDAAIDAVEAAYAGGSPAVPEPAALSGLLLGGLALARRRRRTV